MEKNYSYINDVLADTLIEKAKETKEFDKRGGNSKAYIFGDYVVLKTGNICLKDTKNYGDDVLPVDLLIDRLQEAKKKGIKIEPILGYAYDKDKISKYKSGNSSENWYGSGFLIEPKAKGKEMWDRKQKREDKNYLMDRLRTFATAPQEHFDKFVSDYKALLEMGIYVDPSKETNFFYDEKEGFSFIDLGIRDDEKYKEKELSFLHRYCTMPALGYLQNADDMTKDEVDEIVKNNKTVFEKCKTAMIKNEVISEKELEECLKAGAEEGYESKRVKLEVLGVNNFPKGYNKENDIEREF